MREYDPNEIAREALHMRAEEYEKRNFQRRMRERGANGPGDAAAPDPYFTLFDDIETSPRKIWRVQDFRGEGEINCTFGPPSSGKSVIVGDRNAHIAAGMPWFGKRVEQCAVLHVAAERAVLVKRRYAAFKKHHGVSGLALGLVNRRVDLCTNNKDAVLVLDYCKRLEDAKGLKVGLITIETVNRVLAGGDENSPKDMGALVDRLSFLQQETGANLDVVHHIPSDGTPRLRGHGALLGAVDTTDCVGKIGKFRACTLDKANDGPEGERVIFDLLSVELHYDEETGISTTAPVVVPIEGETFDPVEVKLPAGNNRILFNALIKALLKDGKTPPASNDIPKQTPCVSYQLWHDCAFAMLAGETKVRNQAIKRAVAWLRDNNYVGMWNELVWSMKEINRQ